MSLEGNIKRGAIRVSDDLVIGGLAEDCLLCGANLSSDGCSNVDCINSRYDELIQIGLHKAASLRLLTYH